MVVDLVASNDGDNIILAGEDGVFHLRNDRVLVADDTREEFLFVLHFMHEIATKLLLSELFSYPLFLSSPRVAGRSLGVVTAPPPPQARGG